ncbi:hypothetical protein MMC11_007739 [Xylographa trunciseda]|nr:hypothetical protein [Xylographa trunciseda]
MAMSTSSAHSRDNSSLNSAYEQSDRSSSQIASPGLSDASADDRESVSSSEKATAERRGHGRLPRERYRRAYQALLDESVTTNAYSVHHEPENLLRPSQNGLTFWSSLEKEKLFLSIERRGLDDLQSIAGSIGSKSEPEIFAYLDLLKQATRTHHLYERRPQSVGLFQIPAAHEIGNDCVTALDSMADAYLRKEQELDEEREMERHGSFWLLDDECAAQIEDPNTGDGSPDPMTDNSDLRLPIELLDLEAFRKLSSRVFMNSSVPDDNWRQVAEPGQTPSLFATAMCDLHELVVGLTKRLISSALFFAMSRLRCSRSSNYHHVNHVRRADVLAALDVLGLPHNSNEFWIASARRCKLNVYENPTSKNHSADRLSYDEVESSLRLPPSRSFSMSRVSSSRSPSKQGFENMAEFSTDAERVESDREEISSGSSLDNEASELSEDAPAIDTDLEEATTSTLESAQDSQEIYAETVDCQQSQQEEQRLWTILKKQMPLNTRVNTDRPPKRPRISRKSEQELTDWRTSVEYKNEWEEFGVQRVGFDPAQHDRGRRRKLPITDSKQHSTAPQQNSEISEEDDEAVPDGGE